MKMVESENVIEGKKRKFTEMNKKETPNNSLNSKPNGAKSFRRKNYYLKQQENARTYKESKLMTYFENFWILKKNLRTLKALSAEYKQKIVDERNDDNKDPTLTSEEKQTYNKMMKSEKKKQIKLLNSKIMENKTISLNSKVMENKTISLNSDAMENKTISRPLKIKKPGKYLGINFSDNEELVKFKGHFIKKDGFKRITKLIEKMKAKGATEIEIEKVSKHERRKEEKRLKKEHKQKTLPPSLPLNVSYSDQNEVKKNVGSACFKCNSTDHFARNCPENDKNNMHDSITCFTCNKVGHLSRNCPENDKNIDDSITCFSCNKVGHLSRNCPDASSILPDRTKDKCCDVCGSYEHLRKYCPEKEKKANQRKIITFDD